MLILSLTSISFKKNNEFLSSFKYPYLISYGLVIIYIPTLISFTILLASLLPLPFNFKTHFMDGPALFQVWWIPTVDFENTIK